MEGREYLNRFLKGKSEEEIIEKSRKYVENEEEILEGAFRNIAEVFEEFKTFLSMLKDFFTGEYKDVPGGTIAAASLAIFYYVFPFDIIPDIIPVAGWIDDITVIKFLWNLVREDLQKYMAWKGKQRKRKQKVFA
ncbi:YkvA family protein [Thermotoga neapolitana]|nr:YkvA family protein [Thermotoga neapolitana]KFZ22057.1 hypothetical protein LA10_03563 [Thermotoga neapolitana LA10]HBF11461.1 DUF1232 domain-containing protein [Thermotoga neapolitana]